MIKVFTTDNDGKIALSPDELERLLNEAYWEGYGANNHSYFYRTPNWSPYYTTTTSNLNNATGTTAASSVTISSNAVQA